MFYYTNYCCPQQTVNLDESPELDWVCISKFENLDLSDSRVPTQKLAPDGCMLQNGPILPQIQQWSQNDGGQHQPRLFNAIRNLEIRELAGQFVGLSKVKMYSRSLQQKLDRASLDEKDMVFKEILEDVYDLILDGFGNYVIQKFYDVGTAEQKSMLTRLLQGHVATLTLHTFGCRVIQKALESISAEQQIAIAKELHPYVMLCALDGNGSHVLQKVIECLQPTELAFIMDGIKSHVQLLSTDSQGCRVVQRILENCSDQQVQPILDELHASMEQLIVNQYGNYVIQKVLEHGKQEDKSKIIQFFRGKLLVYSQHKFASNVLEKCVTCATRAERSLLVNEICEYNNIALHVMMKDQFANYVLQHLIDTSDPNQMKQLVTKIQPHMPTIRKYTHGKNIYAKVHKFLSKVGMKREVTQ